MATARVVFRFQSADPAIHEITDSENTAEALASTSKTLRSVTVDNSANGAVSYFKMWNSAAPTVGTTEPFMILMVPASVKRSFIFPEGIVFGTAMEVACVTTPGKAGTTSPTSSVTVQVIVE